MSRTNSSFICYSQGAIGPAGQLGERGSKGEMVILYFYQLIIVFPFYAVFKVCKHLERFISFFKQCLSSNCVCLVLSSFMKSCYCFTRSRDSQVLLAGQVNQELEDRRSEST